MCSLETQTAVVTITPSSGEPDTGNTNFGGFQGVKEDFFFKKKKKVSALQAG